MVNKVIKVSSPGKIILSGEHSVVYGQPALLTAINKRLYVEIKKGSQQTKIITDQNPNLARHALFDVIPACLNVIPVKATSDVAKAGIYKKMLNHLTITIRSEIPVNRGLGSSAALAVALTGALLRWFKQRWNQKLINQIAFSIEKKQHRSPSGADNSISLHGGTIIFQKGKIKFPKHPKFPKFIFLDSGPATETTGEMVEFVKTKKLRNKKTEKLIKAIGQTTKKIISSLLPPLSPLAPLLSQNQHLLEDLGVVGPKAKRIIRQIEALGGAAKICGAGGLKKGSGILLCYHQNPQILLNFARENHLRNYQLKLGAEGLRNES